MFCQNCGFALTQEARFCQSCCYDPTLCRKPHRDADRNIEVTQFQDSILIAIAVLPPSISRYI